MLAIADSDSRVNILVSAETLGKKLERLQDLNTQQGEAVILMDGDLQHPPALLPQMIEAYEQGYDVVSARRTPYRVKNHTVHF